MAQKQQNYQASLVSEFQWFPNSSGFQIPFPPPLPPPFAPPIGTKLGSPKPFQFSQLFKSNIFWHKSSKSTRLRWFPNSSGFQIQVVSRSPFPPPLPPPVAPPIGTKLGSPKPFQFGRLFNSSTVFWLKSSKNARLRWFPNSGGFQIPVVSRSPFPPRFAPPLLPPHMGTRLAAPKPFQSVQ